MGGRWTDDDDTHERHTDTLDEESYKDSTLIMQLLRDNLECALGGSTLMCEWDASGKRIRCHRPHV